ncbi:hypothetical protein AVEN_142389-1 [Araneus ventricosus]|uniref:Tc1-like transposase DDE domain-containing protein n=1 Tax=Araneus ventricosus TaxID=182803 RepID=A0A4Y2FD30_ARAVE|nr:hypothetical protein AVEN_142389-1 [Araneus ventricosus]
MCVSFLYQNLKKSITNLNVGRWYTSQSNNYPKYTSKIGKDYFSKNKIKVLVWPPQSSNFNSIKNSLSVLHQKLPFEERRNKNKFFDRIKDEWRSINKDAAKKLVDNLNQRLKVVIMAKEGQH